MIFIYFLSLMMAVCPLTGWAHNLESLSFKSQLGQDKFVLEKFFTDERGNLKEDGFFIEFGAIDGIYLSNSYALEQLGWKGICIEPIPEFFEQLTKNRTCICLQGCVSDKPGTAIFREVGGTYEVLSGLEDKYHPTHIHLINNVYHKPSKFYEVQCFTLSKIIRDYNVQKIDFMSIDTEGGELGILRSLSDDELALIDVLCVEDNYGDPQFIKFLTSKNFEFVCRLEFDIIFRNKKYMHH